MNTGADLAGRLTLRPGPAGPAIASTRPQGLQRVAVGQRAEQLPMLMAALHALCAHAHRLAARLAVRAARGQGGEPGVALPTTAERLALQAGTARDQLLRLAHDWPRLLPGAQGHAAALADSLRSCPLWRPGTAPGEALSALPAWLAQAWLGQPVAEWLAAWAADPLAWPGQWADRAHTPLARLLAAQQAPTQALATLQRPWAPLAALHGPLPALALAFGEGPLALPAAGEPVATLADGPLVPDTGPWSRHHDQTHPPAHNAWMRLVSRLVDLLQLACPAAALPGPGGSVGPVGPVGPVGIGWLAAGAASPAAGEGLAWVETARGLLAYRVLLDDDESSPAGPRVRALQVLAPTDWNFHPQGVLARALQALAPDDAEASARLAVAFDPCVAFTVVAATSQSSSEEPQHA